MKTEKIEIYQNIRYNEIDEEQLSKRASQMIDSFNEWTHETEEGVEKQHGKLPGLNSSLGTLQDDDVGSLGAQYKKTFKGMANYRDKMPYGLKNAAIMQRPRVAPFKEKQPWVQDIQLLKKGQ